jgi:MYXO-CTERM domain-containing protein
VFDGLALPGGAPESATVEAAGGALQSFSFRQLVVTGVEVAFEMDLLPAADATLTGQRIDVTDGGTLISADFDGDVSQFDVPASHPGWIELLATYQANLEATLALVLTPSLDLCVVGQCFELAAFDIPIDLIDTAQARSFAPVSVYHPLPSVVPPNPSHDFGEVLVGNTLNFEVPLTNQGEMFLEGSVEVVGAENITVFPQYFFAQPGESDGVVVSFAPNEAIETTAFLRITSNDPLEIPLRGLGTSPEPNVGTSEDGYTFEGRSLGITGCGCATTGSTPAAWLLLALPVWVRRRRA